MDTCRHSTARSLLLRESVADLTACVMKKQRTACEICDIEHCPQRQCDHQMLHLHLKTIYLYARMQIISKAGILP